MHFTCATLLYLAAYSATPQEGKWDFKSFDVDKASIVGRVLAVTENSLLVARMEDKNKVVSYPFHARLRWGSYNLLDSEPFRYRRADLIPGDRVVLHVLTSGKVGYCTGFSIRERLNGKVPPTQTYKVGDWQPWHEKIEAFWLQETKGIPMPYHLTGGARKYHFPSYDPHIAKEHRIKPWPAQAPFTYMEYLLFMR